MLSIIYSVKDASRVFSVAEDAIYRCAQRWNGERSVKYGDRSGMPTVPGEKEKKDMKHLLDENDPGKHGINSLTWTCTELRLHFQKNGITVFEESIRCCLRDRGTHYGKATLEYVDTYSADAVREKEEFARRFIRDIDAKSDDLVVLFEDEMPIDRSHSGGYGWALGQRLTLRTPQRTYEKRINGFGTVNPLRGMVFSMNTAEAKSKSLIRFPEKLLVMHRGKRLRIYLDNPTVHRSKVL